MTAPMLLAALGALCLLLAGLGAVADRLDPFGERDDARRRNTARPWEGRR